MRIVSGYNYETERPFLFTDDGQRMFLQIRDKAKRLLKEAGAFRAQELFTEVTGSSWAMIACIDRLVELGEIVCHNDAPEVWSQFHVYSDGTKNNY